jgi:hypothetical protein
MVLKLSARCDMDTMIELSGADAFGTLLKPPDRLGHPAGQNIGQ